MSTEPGVAPDAVEKHPWDYEWHERLEERDVLWQGEGASIRSAIGEGAYWVVHTDWMTAEIILHGEELLKTLGRPLDTFEEDKPMLAELTRLERYDGPSRWELACADVRRRKPTTMELRFEDLPDERTEGS